MFVILSDGDADLSHRAAGIVSEAMRKGPDLRLGLATGTTPLGMYRELAFDEVHDPDYSLWADELCLSTFRVAQCVGAQFDADEDRDDECLLEAALIKLMDEVRSQIHQALREEFGDDSLLFVSLWNTVEYRRDEDIREPESKLLAGDGRTDEHAKHSTEIDWLEDADWILNTEATGQKLAAHEWIAEGMHNLH